MQLEDIFSNKYSGSQRSPGFLFEPQPVCVIGSSAGTFYSILKLITKGFQKSDRLLLITPWESYAIFKGEKKIFSYRDALKNVNRIRRLDVSTGGYGLLSFIDAQDCTSYITYGNEQCFRVRINLKDAVNEVYEQCN